MNVHKTTHQQSFWRESRPGRASTLCPMLAKYSFVGAEKLSAMSCHYPPELLSNWYNVSHREASARFCQMDVLSLPGTHQNLFSNWQHTGCVICGVDFPMAILGRTECLGYWFRYQRVNPDPSHQFLDFGLVIPLQNGKHRKSQTSLMMS